MTKRTLILFLIVTISSTVAYSQIFEDEQKYIIRDSSILLLKQYEEYADLTKDGLTISEYYEENFLLLFSDDASLVNDLFDKKEFISPQIFVEIIKEKYDGGVEIKINTDSIFFKNLKKIEENTYSVQADCQKYTIGLNSQGKIKRKDIFATFTIHFKFKNNKFYDFKIHRIISREIILKNKSDKKIKGLYLGFNLNAHSGKLLSDNNIQYYNKDYQFSSAYSLGLFADYYLSSKYAVSLGVDYYTLNSNFNTKYDNGTNNNLSKTDVDNDDYYLYVNSDLIEKNTIKFISIPLKFKYRHKLYNDMSFYASLGFSTSYVLSSVSAVNGKSFHSAWYEKYNLLVDEAETYNLGEYNYNETYDFKIAKLFFSGIAEAGISIPLKKSAYLNFGVGISHSISNLSYKESSYRDDYIYLHGASKNIFIQSGGIFISYLFKI